MSHDLKEGDLFVYRFISGGSPHKKSDGQVCVVTSAFYHGVFFRNLHSPKYEGFAAPGEIQKEIEVPM